MELKYVILKKENGTAVITFHRPEALNALNSDVLRDIDAAVEDAAADPEVRVVVFTGEGKSFISGADISEMDARTGPGIIEYSRKGAALFRKIETMTKPTIAAVNGNAFGAGSNFFSPDIRIATRGFFACRSHAREVPGFNGRRGFRSAWKCGEGRFLREEESMPTKR